MINIDLIDKDYRLEVEMIMHQRLGPDWAWDHHKNTWNRGPALLFWLVTGGKADLWADNRRFEARRGRLFVMPAEEHGYRGRHNPDNPFEVSWMFIKVIGKDGRSLPVEGIDGIPFQTSLVDVEFCSKLMHRILNSTGTLQTSWLRCFINEIHRQAALHELSAVEGEIQKLGTQIQTHPGKFSGLDDMLSSLSISKDHLIRLFRKQYDMTPGEFLIRARIDHARSLLVISSESVKEIADKLGYSDQFVFSRQFRLRTGVSPKEYRKGAFGIR